MIKAFLAFRAWCRDNNIDETALRISITPLNVEAKARFDLAFKSEFESLMREFGETQLTELPVGGRLMNIPFAICETTDR